MADNVLEGGETAPERKAEDMSHGRTIAEQMVMGLPQGVSVQAMQSNDAPTRVLLAAQNGPDDAWVYLTPEQAFELAHKLAAEAAHAWRFRADLEADGARCAHAYLEPDARCAVCGTTMVELERIALAAE